MYLKNIVIKTNAGETVELSFPKRTSKFEIEYTYIKFLEGKELNKTFSMVKEIVDYISGKVVEYNQNEMLSLDDIRFMSQDNEELKLKPIVKCENRDYFLILKLVDRKGEIIKEVECSLSMENKQIIHEVFGLSGVEIKEKISNADKSNVFFFVSSEAKDEKEDFLENAMCILKDTNEDDSWKEKSFVSRDYLEKLIESSINKKYGISKLFSNMMNDVFAKSEFSLDIEKIVAKRKEIKDKFCAFTLESVLVKK